jgi:hypothetical protein
MAVQTFEEFFCTTMTLFALTCIPSAFPFEVHMPFLSATKNP